MARRELAEVLAEQAMFLAQLETKLGNHGKAATHLRKLYLGFPASLAGLQAAEELALLAKAGKCPPIAYSEREEVARARLLYEAGRFDLAGDVYEGMLKKKSSDNMLKIKLATCRYKQRKNQAAINILKDLVQGNPPQPVRLEAYYLLTRLYWRLEKDKDFEAFSQKILESGNERFRRVALFNLGSYHLEKGHFDPALQYFHRVMKSGPDQKMRFQAQWKVAWIQYLTSRFQEASDGFRHLRSASSRGDVEYGCRYWQARSLLNMNKTQESVTLLQELASQAPTSYYGYAAADFLRSLKMIPRLNDGESVGFPDITLTGEMRSHKNIKHALALHELKLHEFAMVNLDSVAGRLRGEPAVAFFRARCAYLLGHYPRARAILADSFGTFMERPPVDAPPDFIELAYPRVHYDETMKQADKNGLDPHLVWSIIRQESLYDASAVSPAGALGLMQVTPQASGLVGISGRPSKNIVWQLLTPQYNLAIGTKILAKNLGSFDGKVVPAVASYNADIRKVRSWVQKNSRLKSDEFIESIPYQETRNYVKKVLAGYRTYRMVHNRKDLAGLW